MEENEGIDIFEGLSDEELFDGFGDGTEAKAEEPEEEPEEVEEEPEEQIDQSEDDAEGEPEEEPAAEEQPSDPTFTLKHLGETKDYSRDETITLAQKGLDYDRIRTERDSLKAEKAALQEHEDFLNELAELAGTSVEDLMTDTKARLIVADEKKKGNDISFEQAKYRVQTEAKIKKAETPKISKREESFQRFTEQYPGVTDIPNEVWAAFGDGSKEDLAILYTRHLEAEKQKGLQNKLNEALERLKALEQNEKNKKRSTGSRRSNGSPPIDHDLDGWGEY